MRVSTNIKRGSIAKIKGQKYGSQVEIGGRIMLVVTELGIGWKDTSKASGIIYLLNDHDIYLWLIDVY